MIRLLSAALAYLFLTLSVYAQGGMMPGPGTAHSTGGAAASFTFGAADSAFSIQGSSPWTSALTMTTGAGDLPVVVVVNAADFGTGAITGVSINNVAATCVQGTNNASEQAWLCYGPIGALSGVSIKVSFTGTLLAAVATGKITTTTATPFSTGNSTAGQGGGVSTPLAIAATTGSGGIPSNGAGACIYGDFFTGSARTISSITPNQDKIINDTTSNGQNLGFGHSTTSGASSGITINGTTSVFPAWSCASWSP